MHDSLTKHAAQLGGNIGDGSRWMKTKMNFCKHDTGTSGQGVTLNSNRSISRRSCSPPGRVLWIGDTGNAST